jgi:hypothetical protein
VQSYAKKAGISAHPHTFRHQAITFLTRHSGLADAELQLITGHARRETLAIYRHVALDGELETPFHGSPRLCQLLSSAASAMAATPKASKLMGYFMRASYSPLARNSVVQ